MDLLELNRHFANRLPDTFPSDTSFEIQCHPEIFASRYARIHQLVLRR